MKIGILTFHSQLNYGALLQCWALSKMIKLLGHQPIVLDKWKNGRCGTTGPLEQTRVESLKNLIRIIIGMIHVGVISRYRKTRAFLRNVGLTDFHFCSWSELDRPLGVDCVVAGSDQIWNCAIWSDLSTYMLENAPEVPFISYAASFGIREIPNEFRSQYKEGLSRYCARSVREDEGLQIVKNLGLDATTVVDPTILLPPCEWYKMISKKSHEQRSDFILLYLIGLNSIEFIREASRVAGDLQVKFVLVTPAMTVYPRYALWERHPGVLLAANAGPYDFVRLISKARAVITDSFHATAISSIYDTECRVIRPNNDERQSMFARLDEFVSKYSDGDIIQKDLTSAVASVLSGTSYEWNHAQMVLDREHSRGWLVNALQAVMK